VTSGPKLLYFFRGEDPASRPGFEAGLEARGWQVDSIAVSDAAPARGITKILFSPHRFGSYDVVSASEYFLTWAVCLRSLFDRPKQSVVALTFNQSSRRLIRTGVRPLDWLLNRLWRRVSVFMVHSQAEARMFAGVHDIPSERFVFSHWGYDLPDFSNFKVEIPNEPYVTMVGRNNRDLPTFYAATKRAGVKGVLITAAYMVDQSQPPPPENITLLVDRPMGECLKYVAGSFCHLVLVTDEKRGAGHISAVSAMLLAKPQIFSDVAPLADYLIDDFNGISVPVGDAEAVARAIDRLRSDPELAKRLGSSGKTFALETMSHLASTDRMIAVFTDAIARRGKQVSA
jgi:hypothetical protein